MLFYFNVYDNIFLFHNNEYEMFIPDGDGGIIKLYKFIIEKYPSSHLLSTAQIAIIKFSLFSRWQFK